ncbi:MAG: carboxypeptidase-like regulatory domain-containing protein, partial [Methanomicrobiales archaeon]|nr:carboxypeptidase-like regulatory domain-containing protein [Methanomicrobiales archaeon]
MARLLISSSLLSLVVAITMICGAITAGIVVSFHVEEPTKASILQTPGLGAINVTVVDDVARIIVGATVKLNGTTVGVTGSDGSYLIHDLAPNETDLPYTVSAAKTNYWDSLPQSCAVVENETTNITLVIQGSTILGTVNSPTGPISGAVVSIISLGYSADVSPVNGSYRLDGLPGGTHSVTASAQGYVPQTQDVVVPVADSVLVNFILTTQNGSISGSTYHSQLGTPLNATNVSVQIGLVTVTVPSDSSGNYNITNVPEGVYTVTASRDGFLTASATDVAVTRGNLTSGIDLYLVENPTRLYGVVRSGQVLLVGANITVVGTAVYALSGADGNYEIGNLSTGTYVIQATVQGYETQTVSDVVILPGSDTQLNFNMTGLPGARLRGIVKDSRSNAPLANVLVTIIDLSPQPRSVFTNINGEFEFPALTADNYTLRFEKTGYRPLEIGKVEAIEGSTNVIEFQMTPLRDTFGGFIEGLDMAHSMMLLALALTFIILGVAVVLRVRSFTSPATAPAVYDQSEEGRAEQVPVLETPDEEDTS